MAKLPDDLQARLARLAHGEGVQLLAVEVTGVARKPTVRLVLDRDGGVSLADCENVSRQVSALLDAEDPFPSAYTLEVSSPGLDRKLYSDEDYTRFAGQAVRVRMRPTWRGGKLVDGVLVGKEGGTVRVRDRNDAVLELPATEVFETRLQPFAEGAQPAPGKKKR